ncbi:MAG: hypothetical protein HS113_30965 [Verrucomicrobiales bacterium]|nr:hypothetical protein [Verrucomicrobiales bacterium]
MSPDLERLLEAYYEKRTCPLPEKAHRAATFERLVTEAMARKPGVGRDEFLSALAERYADFRRQRLRAERDRLSRLR